MDLLHDVRGKFSKKIWIYKYINEGSAFISNQVNVTKFFEVPTAYLILQLTNSYQTSNAEIKQ